jgi:hypothetical protein
MNPNRGLPLLGCSVLAVVPLLLVATASATRSAAQTPDAFARISVLIGRWQGAQEGKPGIGTATREYSRALGDRFIRVVNRSEYPAQDKNAKGEVHHDEGFISFDRARKLLVLRQFHGEGFVNQYVEDAGSTPTRISFTSESIENIPAGWRARETYTFFGADEFEEIFELAEPGKPFTLYSRGRFKRLP